MPLLWEYRIVDRAENRLRVGMWESCHRPDLYPGCLLKGFCPYRTRPRPPCLQNFIFHHRNISQLLFVNNAEKMAYFTQEHKTKQYIHVRWTFKCFLNVIIKKSNFIIIIERILPYVFVARLSSNKLSQIFTVQTVKFSAGSGKLRAHDSGF